MGFSHLQLIWRAISIPPMRSELNCKRLYDLWVKTKDNIFNEVYKRVRKHILPFLTWEHNQ